MSITMGSGTGAREELVVLVDDSGAMIGTAPKATVHTARTPLHRAFSCYVFNDAGQFLATRRATTKLTFPGLWTNSVCGHPAPGESDELAIIRRAEHELGLQLARIEVALPDFRYRATAGGIVENEICPVYVARAIGEPDPRPDEVHDYQWISWQTFVANLRAAPGDYSPWCALQVEAFGQTPPM